MKIKCKGYDYPTELSQITEPRGTDEFPADCAITYQLTQSAQPAVGAAKHHRQNAYLTAIFGHYIGGYFN